ncbi:Uncharacterised protein [uncultured archaeon]|nr:Uncharacterised protein [uncultured archaeon]
MHTLIRPQMRGLRAQYDRQLHARLRAKHGPPHPRHPHQVHARNGSHTQRFRQIAKLHIDSGRPARPHHVKRPILPRNAQRQARQRDRSPRRRLQRQSLHPIQRNRHERLPRRSRRSNSKIRRRRAPGRRADTNPCSNPSPHANPAGWLDLRIRDFKLRRIPHRRRKTQRDRPRR